MHYQYYKGDLNPFNIDWKNRHTSRLSHLTPRETNFMIHTSELIKHRSKYVSPGERGPFADISPRQWKIFGDSVKMINSSTNCSLWDSYTKRIGHQKLSIKAPCKGNIKKGIRFWERHTVCYMSIWFDMSQSLSSCHNYTQRAKE